MKNVTPVDFSESAIFHTRVDSHCREILLVYARLYYYMRRNFDNLVGVEQWYFSLIRNTYMRKLQTFCG